MYYGTVSRVSRASCQATSMNLEIGVSVACAQLFGMCRRAGTTWYCHPGPGRVCSDAGDALKFIVTAQQAYRMDSEGGWDIR